MDDAKCMFLQSIQFYFLRFKIVSLVKSRNVHHPCETKQWSCKALDLQSPYVTPVARFNFMRLRPLLSGPFIGELEMVIICDKYWFSFGCIGTKWIPS